MTNREAQMILSKLILEDKVTGDDAKAVLMGVKALNESAWHPYPEEQPEKEGEYLVTETSCINSDILFVSIEYYSGDNWTDEDYGDNVWDISQYIRAWMPLPKPYGKEKDNG